MSTDSLAQRRLPAPVIGKVLVESHVANFSAALKLTQAPRRLPQLAERYAIPPVLTVDDIRRENLIALISEARTAAALGARSGLNPSLISQWKTGAPDSKTGKPRQLSSESCRRLETAMKKPTGWMDQQHSHAGPATGVVVTPLAQELSDPTPDDEPLQHTWEFILSADVTALSKRFIAAVPDGALAPNTPKGTEYLFASRPTGHPRDSVVVIVQAAGGRRYMRLFFALAGGAWEARARDSAYPSLHSERDGLQLLAVAVMRPGGEG